MMKTYVSVTLAAACLTVSAYALNNGLALTPPMGWLSWERYRCNTDCLHDPDNCISEKLYKRMADLMVSEGYQEKGYTYINIDDCWSMKTRDAKGFLVPDPDRFPSGIKALADYVHARGLNLGIYADVGTFTCGGYPGSQFYLEQDAQTFANWTVDMVKLDGCHVNISDMQYGYPAMELFLNATGRPMLYSCSWPAYLVFHGQVPDYKKTATTCNIWRNYADIQDSWESVKRIIDYYGNDTGDFSQVAGPGHFNDPDMLIIGDYGLSYDEQRVQMAMWSILAAPLLISADLRKIRPESKKLLQNDYLIRANQDRYGYQGRRIIKTGALEVWTKSMGLDGKGMAYAFLNRNEGGEPLKVSMPLYRLGLSVAEGYNITEAFTGKFVGTLKPHDILNVSVDPSGVYMGIAYFDC